VYNSNKPPAQLLSGSGSLSPREFAIVHKELCSYGLKAPLKAVCQVVKGIVNCVLPPPPPRSPHRPLPSNQTMAAAMQLLLNSPAGSLSAAQFRTGAGTQFHSGACMELEINLYGCKAVL